MFKVLMKEVWFMSYKDGMAAVNLEMPGRVPRTEYSLGYHQPLIETVSGVKLTDKSTDEERTNAYKALMKAWNFDLNWNVRVSSDALGKYVTYMGHAVYAADGSDFRPIGKPAFEDEDAVLAFDAIEMLGPRNHNELVKMFDDNYDDVCNYYPDAVNMTGIYVTCISAMIELFGWELLLTAAGISPDGFGRVVERYTDWVEQYFNALADCKAPVVMIHDDIVWTEGAFITPEWYRQYVFPAYKKLFAPLHDAKKKILFTSDGNFTEFIDDIAGCGISGFCLEPLTDMKYIAEKYGKTHSFIGNADTRILLRGTKEDIYNEVKRCMDIGKSCPGFIMAVGNHIPANTPLDSCLYYNEYYEKMSKR